MSASFVVGSGRTVTVGRNFYVHGASMTGSANWTLTLPTHWATGTSGVLGSASATGVAAVSWSGVTLNSTTTDWFGLPFAVAITTAGGMSVTYSQASGPVAAAQTSFAAITNSNNNANWDFVQPTISTASTRFDNLVEVTFSKSMLDANGEALTAVGQSTAADNFRLGATAAAGVNAGYLWDFTTGTITNSGETSTYTTTQITSSTNANRTVISFQTALGNSWNTDATGSGVTSPVNGGAGASASTNRSGVHQTTVPNLIVEKGRLYATTGNPIKNYDGQNSNGGTTSTPFNTTADLARPVLIKIDLGQAAKTFPPTTAEDGHNYWHLVWSEPVDLLDSTGTADAISGINTVAKIGSPPTSTAATGNKTAVLAFGDSYTSSGTTTQLTGIAQYSGTVMRGSRTQQAGGSPVTLTTAANQTSVTPTNSLARSAAGNDLYIYLTGASTGSADATTWDGFWWGDTTTPSGQIYTVVSAYVNQVKDRAVAGAYSTNNPVEDQNVSWAAATAVASPSADPKLAFQTAADTQAGINTASPETSGVTTWHSGWEADAPDFAPYTTAVGSYEVVPIDSTGNNNTVDEVHIHIISNQANSGQGWTPTSSLSSTSHPDTGKTHWGVRDTSLTYFYLGFTLDQLPSTGAVHPAAGWVTAVDNTLFDGSAGLPVTTTDDGYFKVSYAGVAPGAWKPAGSFQFSYDPYAGMATNLTGRLFLAATGRKAIDRTPPTITLTLAANGGTKVYVQFSRQVVAIPLGGNPAVLTGSNVLLLSGTSNSNSIVGVKLVDAVGTTGQTSTNSATFQQMVLTLAKPLQPQDYATATLKAQTNGSTITSTISGASNDMDTSVSYPISTLAIDLVQPVWASDGSGGEANKAGTDRVIHDFTGLEALTARDITMQVNVAGGSTFTSLPIRLFYDFNVKSTKTTTLGLWLPTGIFQPVNQYSTATPQAAFAVVPTVSDTAVRTLSPTATNSAGNLKTFLVPGSDSGFSTATELQFVFRVGALYSVRGTSPTDPTQISVYRIPLKSIKEQKNGVTILHNVIDPTQGQKTEILYTMKKAGVVTAQVFALDGSLVKILQRGRQAAGDYSLFWDGKNEGGKIVARGVYFVRVVAPDTDETRNVLVIK
jgi:hypothetical protein